MSMRLDDLRDTIRAQGRRVQSLIESALESLFTLDAAAALAAIARDEEIDRVDVEIEQRAVSILADACKAGSTLGEADVRSLLTIVKVNNELERIADVAVSMAEAVPDLRALPTAAPLPPTFRVLTNSVIGILRDVVQALHTRDAKLAKVVLMSEAAVGEFRKALVRELQTQISTGRMPVPQAALLHDLAMFGLNMADHCTNIAEQVIYVATGKIVRHMQGRWEEVPLPGGG
jgi:phosphate transport system protein